jgi:hypothetical protein
MDDIYDRMDLEDLPVSNDGQVHFALVKYKNFFECCYNWWEIQTGEIRQEACIRIRSISPP